VDRRGGCRRLRSRSARRIGRGRNRFGFRNGSDRDRPFRGHGLHGEGEGPSAHRFDHASRVRLVRSRCRHDRTRRRSGVGLRLQGRVQRN
jgi:hypothetical protein